MTMPLFCRKFFGRIGLLHRLWLGGAMAVFLATTAGSAIADEFADEIRDPGKFIWPTPTGFVEISVGGGFGFGGWTDAAADDSGATRPIRHSILGGFVGTIGVGAQLTNEIGAVFRMSLGGGAFFYRRPSDGPEAATSFAVPTKDSTYGRFALSVGPRFEWPAMAGLSFAVQAGPMLIVPMTELWTYRRATDVFSRQDYVISYEFAGGAFAELMLLWAVEPGVRVRLAMVAEVAHLQWRQMVRRSGSGSYAPFTPATFSGTIRISDSATHTTVSPTVDGFYLIRADADSDANGIQTMLGVTIGVSFDF